MREKFFPPRRNAKDFTCPSCGVYAYQFWRQKVFSNNPNVSNSHILLDELAISECNRCQQQLLWDGDSVLRPRTSIAPAAVADMPDEVALDFEEARQVFSASPRASAALLRLALQKLCKALGQPGENINSDIKALVQQGLPVQVQQSLDVVRVVGNNAVHPGEIDLRDTPDVALSLFGLINIIVETMISQPKHIQALFDALPEGAKAAIEKRDRAIS